MRPPLVLALCPADPTTNAVCVTNIFAQFNVVHHPFWFLPVSTLTLIFFQAQALRLGQSRQHLNQSRLHFSAPPFPFSEIMKMADFLERAMMVSSAVGEVFTLAWTHAEVNSYCRPICSCPRLSARGFLRLLGGSPLHLLSLVHPSHASVFLPGPLNAFNATSAASGSFSGIVVYSVPSLSGGHRSRERIPSSPPAAVYFVGPISISRRLCVLGTNTASAATASCAVLLTVLGNFVNNKLNEDQTSRKHGNLSCTDGTIYQYQFHNEREVRGIISSRSSIDGAYVIWVALSMGSLADATNVRFEFSRGERSVIESQEAFHQKRLSRRQLLRSVSVRPCSLTSTTGKRCWKRNWWWKVHRWRRRGRGWPRRKGGG